MTAIDSNSQQEPQTPGQWAVRWVAIVSVALLCASVPLVHLGWHVVLGHEDPAIRTRSQIRAPEITVDNVVSGLWMSKKERELQEASPIVWALRGHWNELRYRAGIPQSDRVTFGDDEWFFISSSVRPNNEGFEKATEKRRKVFAEVRDTVRAAGAELVMVILPDKARIYPDKVFPGGRLPADKVDNYATILAELDELGIARVDLATPMRAARAAVVSDKPQDQLYYARDTHWRPGGALIAGQEIAATIEARFGDRLGARRTMRLTGPSMARAVGDLTSQLGMLAAVRPDAVHQQRTAAMSLLTDDLAEVRHYYGAELVGPTGAVGVFGEDPDAEILMIGSSFAEANGMVGLSIALARSVRANIIRGAAGILPLKATLAELRRGTKAKVVVWEIVERGLFEGFWLDPKL